MFLQEEMSMTTKCCLKNLKYCIPTVSPFYPTNNSLSSHILILGYFDFLHWLLEFIFLCFFGSCIQIKWYSLQSCVLYYRKSKTNMTVAGGRDVQEPATNTESKVRGDKSCRGRRRFLLKFFSSEYFKEMLH